MTSVIMPAGSSSVDLNTLLAVLADPTATKNSILLLNKATTSHTAALQDLTKAQAAFDKIKKEHEADIAKREDELSNTLDSLASKTDDISRREAIAKTIEVATRDREVAVAQHERDLADATEVHKKLVAALDAREAEVTQREKVSLSTSEQVAKLKADYEQRMKQLKALAI